MSETPREEPAGEGQGEWEDRGSRFLAWVFPCGDEDHFAARLEQARQAHPKARHHCWAWRFGDAYRFSDDGEPGGTAGRPMLQVLEGSGLVELAAICVRYFGGVKLGTGGLVRAYAGATARALDAAGRRVVRERVLLPLHLPFTALGLRTELEALFPGCQFDGAYTADGWRGQLEIDAAEAAPLRALLAERGLA